MRKALIGSALVILGLVGIGVTVDDIDLQPRTEVTYGGDSQQAPFSRKSSDPDVQISYEQLGQLEVKGRAPKTGYDRAKFGQAWSDDVTVAGGHNGCDTRNDILRRDLDGVQVRPGTQGCLAETGTLFDPYTGETITFTRGDGQVEIDHVVPLADAWVKGAQLLDEQTRRNFANDPRNLLAVGTSVNRQKGAADAATWQPPRTEFRCEYARIQIDVKHAYNLWVTPAERDALERELGRC